MKWLGQHIVDFPALFKSTVTTLDNLVIDMTTKTFNAEGGLYSHGISNPTYNLGRLVHMHRVSLIDNDTTGSGTADFFSAVSLRKTTLKATNSSVTTTNAATLYIEDHIGAGANMTITNPKALWVDGGICQFDSGIWVQNAVQAMNHIGQLTVGNQSNITMIGSLFGLIVNPSSAITASSDMLSGDGALVHIDAYSLIDEGTLASGTVAKLSTVNIEQATIGAANLSVTTSDASTLYIAGPPVESDNMTFTREWALWVDSGNVKLDGGLTVDGTITGDVTGDVTGTASVATTVRITDNESTNEDNALIFTAGGDVDGGNIGLESDGTCTYNPSTGKITATGFIGALTGDVTGSVTGDVLGNLEGQADTVATIAGLAPNTATTAASQPNITHLAGLASIGTGGGNTDILSSILSIRSSVLGYPQIQLYSQSNDAYAGAFSFIKTRGGTPADGQDNDVLGTINFTGYDDGTPSVQSYARIYSDIADATSGQEAGRLTFQVAEYDGTVTTGLKLDGDTDADGEIDVTIGAGAASLTTIAGDLSVTGKITSGGSQIINLKGFCTLIDGKYQFAEDLEDTKAPYEMAVLYDSDTIDADTEVAQNWMFRANGFHVPFAATINSIQLQTTCNNAGTVTAAIVEYVPSDAGGNTNDYPRTVYKEIAITSDNSNNKVDTTNVTSGIGGSGVVNAGSHLIMMAKGDGTSDGGKAFFNAAIEIIW